MEYPRVLIVSNECLSQSSSNGRTLLNFFVGWPKEKIAQFFIRKQAPDFEACGHFYCVTDKQALNAFCCKGKSGGILEQTSAEQAARTATKPYSNKNALTAICRELIWRSNRWGYRDLLRWAKDFDPQVVVLQAGDFGFMFRLARKMAETFKIPLVIYNSEGYYFKDYDYFQAKGLAHWLYPVQHRYFVRQFRKTMAMTNHVVYICDTLRKDYEKEFSTPSDTIYTATTMLPAEKKPHENFVISYLGNLSLCRHEPLIEIANALQEIDPALHLDVYGKPVKQEVQEALENCPGIRMMGFVPYEQVVEVMQQSDLLVHGESSQPFYRKHLKYGFSTKIPDSLASGTCFLVYAPKELACADYLLEQGAAYVVFEEQELKETLRLLISEPEVRSRYLSRAAEVVGRNHATEVSARRFQDILRKAAEK